MDERQAQIRERAGLEESRLNLEFIEWLRKWGTPLLLVAAVAAGAFALKERMAQGKRVKTDEAFAEYEAARGAGNPSPDALLAVASARDGVGAISDLARIDAADAYLGGVRRGLKVGAVLATDPQGQQTGELVNAEDVLTEEDRLNYLNRANELYQMVHDSADGAAKLLTRLNAMYGLAAVAESREQYDAAREWYQKIADATESTNYAAYAKVARDRAATIGELATIAPLPREADVPKPPPVMPEKTMVDVSSATLLPGPPPLPGPAPTDVLPPATNPPEPAATTPPVPPTTPPPEPTPAPK